MSGAAAPQEPAAAIEPAAAESIARRWGWKPKEDFKGDPEKWVDATAFVERARETPAILIDRVQVMDRKMSGLEQKLGQQSSELQAARQAVSDMSEMVRRGDERGYKRARAELMAQRDEAIDRGDKATVRVADQAIAELDENKPAPKAAPTEEKKPAPAAPAAPQPEVLEFYREFPMYTTDADFRAEADAMHIGLIQTRSNLTLAENLKLVGDRMKRLFPEKFAKPKPNGAADPEPEADPEPPTNRRREEAPVVTPSADPGGRQQRGSRRSFDTMPKESKDAYTRYARQLEGKGKPLTKDEWAADYWAQFEEV